MRQKPILRVCLILWAVFVIVKTREVWYDVRSFLNEEELVGFVQGWDILAYLIRDWDIYVKKSYEAVALVGYLCDVTVLAVLPGIERKLGKLQGYLTALWMALYIPRSLMVAGAFLGIRGVRPGTVYIPMLFPAVCAVIVILEIIRDRRENNF